MQRWAAYYCRPRISSFWAVLSPLPARISLLSSDFTALPWPYTRMRHSRSPMADHNPCYDKAEERRSASPRLFLPARPLSYSWITLLPCLGRSPPQGPQRLALVVVDSDPASIDNLDTGSIRLPTSKESPIHCSEQEAVGSAARRDGTRSLVLCPGSGDYQMQVTWTAQGVLTCYPASPIRSPNPRQSEFQGLWPDRIDRHVSAAVDQQTVRSGVMRSG